MRTRLSVTCLALLVASNASADLRIFDVGMQHQQEVYGAIRDVLNDNPGMLPPGLKTFGRVELLPNGQILVNAQPEALVQLDQVIQAIRERPVAAAPRVTLRYWAVLGTSAGADPTNTPGIEPPPALNPVLAELRRINGNLEFRVIGSAAVTSDSGQNGELTARVMSATQNVHVQGDMANAFLRVNLRGNVFDPRDPRNPGDTFPIGEIELQTTLRRGEFVVIGESQGQSGELEGPIFYIVHWAGDR